MLLGMFDMEEMRGQVERYYKKDSSTIRSRRQD